ncbi:MAG: hypothetical protein KF716_26115 [Anaerolineae bacterium]|nr:hypothetical protein [Anaerolineae bacterium]
MAKWEYCLILKPNYERLNKITSYLITSSGLQLMSQLDSSGKVLGEVLAQMIASLGMDGWEIASTDGHGLAEFHGHTGGDPLLFKRPLE